MSFEKTIDTEANLFARCLLMPESFLRADVKKMAEGRRIDMLDGRDTFIRDLAKKYKVPELAMTLRLHELGMII